MQQRETETKKNLPYIYHNAKYTRYSRLAVVEFKVTKNVL